MDLLQAYNKLYYKIKYLDKYGRLNDKALKDYNEILKSINDSYINYENVIFDLQMQNFVLSRQIIEFHEMQKNLANNIINIERRKHIEF